MTVDRERREQLRRSLVAECEQAIEQRLDRYLEIHHAGIVAYHHFASASSEAIDLYRDGRFLSAVMVSQAVAEGIWKFVLDRNQQPASDDRPTVAPTLVSLGIVSQGCADSFIRVWRSFRNDVHHMNPKVAMIPFPELARRNLMDLGIIERELFAWTVTEPGAITPNQPKYWDLQLGDENSRRNVQNVRAHSPALLNATHRDATHHNCQARIRFEEWVGLQC